MTANKGPDSDLIFSLGIIFADGPALPLIATVVRGREGGSCLPSSAGLPAAQRNLASLKTVVELKPKHQL